MNVKVLPSLPASSELSGSTDLRDLFRLIESRLSSELQLMVLSSISGLFKSLANSLATLNYIDNQLPICEASDTDISYRPFSHSNILEKIGVDTVDILGEICLKRIGEIDNSSFYHHEIILSRRREVQGLQVAFGTYGVVDLRVIYRDSSTSSWINKQQRKWVTTYRGSDLRRLRTLSDVSSP